MKKSKTNTKGSEPKKSLPFSCPPDEWLPYTHKTYASVEVRSAIAWYLTNTTPTKLYVPPALEEDAWKIVYGTDVSDKVEKSVVDKVIDEQIQKLR